MATYCMMGGLINLRSLGKATLFRTFPHLTNQHIKTSTATLRLLKTAAHVTETREQERKSRAMVTDELLLLFYEFQRRQGGAISIQSYYKIHLNIFDFIFAPSERDASCSNGKSEGVFISLLRREGLFVLFSEGELS